MSLYAIYFEPEDWLSFREVRRFGPSDITKSVIPSPFPFYGAIRTALMKKYGVELEYHKEPKLPEELKKKLGDTNDPGIIKLYGPFVYSEENGKKKHYFPAPKNVYKKQDEYKTMVLSQHVAKIEDLELQLAWIPEITDVSEAEEPYIELQELRKLQKGEPFQLCKPENYKQETKIGIGLQKEQKATREGLIYSMTTYRFKNGGFFMLTDSEKTVEEVNKLDGVFLGSKQRWVKVKVEPFPENIFEKINSENVAIMLLTPAIYKNGIVPENSSFGSTKILGISAGRKIPISGWDYANGRPKELHHAVSPGTVYYLDKQPMSESEIINASKLNNFGFGKFIYLPYKKA